MNLAIHQTFKTLTEALRVLRKERKITLRGLADVVKVSFTYLSKLENVKGGRDNPSEEVLQRIAQALEVPPIELMVLARQVPKCFFQEPEFCDFLSYYDGLTPEERIRTLARVQHKAVGGKLADSSQRIQAAGRTEGVLLAKDAQTLQVQSRDFIYSFSFQRLASESYFKIQGKVLFPGRERPEIPEKSEVILFKKDSRKTLDAGINLRGNFTFSQVPAGQYIAMIFLGTVMESCYIHLSGSE